MNEQKQLTVSHKQGFTMIEVLVAIVVIGIGVLGPLALAVRNVPDSHFIKNQMAATYLAKEGIELFVAKSDSLADDTGNTFPEIMGASSCSNSSGCGIELPSGASGLPNLTGCSVDGNCDVSLDGVIFTRVLTLSDVTNGNAPDYFEDYRLDSTVSWREKTRTESVTLSRYFFHKFSQ